MTPALTFENAQVLRGDGLARVPISVADGVILDAPQGRKVDLSGFLLLPGIVDAHGDAFERHVAPRRGAVTDLAPGLIAAEAELAANGITTATLAQFWSWEGGMRGAAFATRLAAALDAHDATLDMRLQLRVEVGCHEDFDAIRALVSAQAIRYVVFNDHLPHDRLAAGKTPPRLQGQALKAGRSPEAHHALLRRLHEGRDDARAALPGLATDLLAQGVRLGSHDDGAAEDRAFWHGLGARIAEFPTTMEAAQAARAAGDRVVMGAPNVQRGGSHAGSISARELIEAGLCDALASDYHYPSPHRAAFALVDAGIPLAKAWALVSSGPARVLGLSDRGALTPGQRADIVVVSEATRRIAGTIAGGQIADARGEFAARLLSAR